MYIRCKIENTIQDSFIFMCDFPLQYSRFSEKGKRFLCGFSNLSMIIHIAFIKQVRKASIWGVVFICVWYSTR